ncbi:hypothetical protein K0U27_01265 [archaeon]|nr:hypothetical protein [archaeon]
MGEILSDVPQCGFTDYFISFGVIFEIFSLNSELSFTLIFILGGFRVFLV